MQTSAADVLDLRDVARRRARSLRIDTPLSEDERRSAQVTWRGRMVNEHVSARVFAALQGQAVAAEVGADWIAMARRFETDELHHGELCGAVLEALGGPAMADLPALAAVPEHAEVDRFEALLRNVLSISCLSETVAVALITAERERNGPAAIDGVLRSILSDEIQHARMGWALLDSVGARIDDALRDRLRPWLALCFAQLEAHELRFLPDFGDPGQAAESVGVCHGGRARSLFYATVAEVIVPGLQARGFHAAAAWRERSFALAA